MVKEGLAVGRQVHAFSYNGEDLQPDQLLGEVYQIKRSGGGASLNRFGELGALVRVMLSCSVPIIIPPVLPHLIAFHSQRNSVLGARLGFYPVN
jgi:hypothetical protein